MERVLTRTNDEDHEKDKFLREAIHLAITIIQGALQSGKSELCLGEIEGWIFHVADESDAMY